MILELLALASLLVVDPTGDAHGAGDLVPPSAALYADRSAFDLVEVEVGGEEVLTVRVTLAGIPDPGRLPNGLTLPVLDVYLDLEEGGETLALPGVGMAMADRHGWEVAMRVHGDDAFLRLADDPDGAARPVAVEKDGSALVLVTTLPVPETVRDVQVVTGVYDPFSRDAWRPLAARPSPWAFASETAAPPVVDLLAANDAMQREAIRSYVLPSSQRQTGPVGWLLLMFGGLGVAAGGLWLRRRASSRSSPTAVGAASHGGEPDAPSDDPSAQPAATGDDDEGTAPAPRSTWPRDGWADERMSTDEHRSLEASQATEPERREEDAPSSEDAATVEAREATSVPEAADGATPSVPRYRIKDRPAGEGTEPVAPEPDTPSTDDATTDTTDR